MEIVCKEGKCVDQESMDFKLKSLKKKNILDKIEEDMLKGEV